MKITLSWYPSLTMNILNSKTKPHEKQTKTLFKTIKLTPPLNQGWFIQLLTLTPKSLKIFLFNVQISRHKTQAIQLGKTANAIFVVHREHGAQWLPSDVAASGRKTLAMGLPAPENLLSAVFIRYATKMACLHMKTQCATSPVELRSLSIYTLKKIFNRSPLNNTKHQTLIKIVCNKKHQVHVPALITAQLGLRKTLYHHSLWSKGKH